MEEKIEDVPSWEGNLVDIEFWIWFYFMDRLTDEDVEIFKDERTRNLRNKLLHCNFKESIELIKGKKSRSSQPMTVFSIEETEDGNYQDACLEKDMYSWFHDANNQRLFHQAQEILRKAIKVIEKLF